MTTRYTTRITSKGQVTMPKAIRDLYGLEEGDYLDLARGRRRRRPVGPEEVVVIDTNVLVSAVGWDRSTCSTNGAEPGSCGWRSLRSCSRSLDGCCAQTKT